MKSYLLPNIVNERNIELTVIKKVNPFVSLNFGDVQHMDIIIFLGGATSLDFFLKAYKTSETKTFFPYEWFDHPNRMQNTEIPPYGVFCIKLRNCSPLETKYTDFVYLLINGLTTEQVVIKLELSKPPLLELRVIITCNKHDSKKKSAHSRTFCGGKTIKMLYQLWKPCKKRLHFTNNKDNNMLRLGCTLPNMANICLYKSTDAISYPFPDGYKNLLEKIREDDAGDPSNVFYAKQLLMKLSFESLQTFANLLLGLIPANYTPTQCVNPCPLLFTRVRILI